MSDTTALAVRPGAAPLIEWNQAQIDLLKRTIASGPNSLANDELALFISVCKRTQLDPFLRQIYPIKSKGRLIIHVAIDGRRATAQRTGLMTGTDGPYWCGEDEVWRDVWLSQDPPAAAKFTVFKRGSDRGYTAVVRYRSFAGESPNWRAMPDHMLAKCAEDHALRKAFPYEMAGLPTYTPALDRDQDDAVDEVAVEYERLQAGHVDGEYKDVPPGTKVTHHGDDFAAEHADILSPSEELKKRFTDLVDEIRAAVPGSKASLPSDDEPAAVWQEKYDKLATNWAAAERNPRNKQPVGAA